MNSVSDPWVITQRDKLRYQEQFKALQPQNGFITGNQAKGFFLQSQLPPLILGQIWGLADIDSDGKMNITEFSIACKLISLKMRGMEVPKTLPPTLLDSLDMINTTPTGTISPLESLKHIVSASKTNNCAPVAQSPQNAAVPIASENIPGVVTQPIVTPAVIMTPGTTVLPNSGSLPIAQPAVTATNAVLNVTNITPQPGIIQLNMTPGVVPPNSIVPTIVPLAGITSTNSIVASKVVQSLPTTAVEIKRSSVSSTPPQSNAPSRHTSISECPPSLESPQYEWAVKAQAKRKYSQVFNAADRHRTGYLTGVQARGILVQSKLPQATLAQIWTLSDLDCDGRLSCDEFILAMFLCDKAMNGEKIPTTLPLDWIPPSFRKTTSRPSSVIGTGSRPGSQTSSRHASVSSQGALDPDPAACLPQTTFEDKRKENFDKGQAELERRRKLLEEQQRKEKEERERKEREEAEKREKARLEAERKQQEELERQLQKQREIELEKEEQRKRDLEAKEAARKELEKQRLLEWEQARIAELNTQKQREQEKVLKQKASNTQLSIELSTLNEKIKSLSQNICETRADVTNVKSIIDGMRSERDTSVNEMAQLKARIKEQNAKLLQLAQERSKWDAKVKSTGILADAAQEEQLSAAFAHKQLIIKQLKDKVENTANEIESKEEDIKSHDLQMTEAKAELSNLIKKCEELYGDYDIYRTQVLEIKYNKKNENAAITSAWDTNTSWSKGATSITVDKYSSHNDNITTATTATIPMVQEHITNTSAQDVNEVPEGFVKYRAIYEFSARNADEISFMPGDIILVPIEQNAEPGWLAGEINGHTGWFPETYVEKMEETIGTQPYLSQDTSNDNMTEYKDIKEKGDTKLRNETEYYIATYPYESEEVGDLTFSAGEMIMVTKKEGDWWTGTIGNRTGMFPSNYVQKADVGSTAPSVNQVYLNDKKDETIYNDNVQNEFSKKAAIIDKVEQEKKALKQDGVPSQLDADATAEEKRTNEELDTEVSQINTQSSEKTQSITESVESYSRPMSRTSSMTPGMRAKRYEIAQVIAPYEATSTEQLSLTRGQLIMIRKKMDSGWWEGELQAKGRRRQIGWFPATYVKVLQGGRNSGRNTPVSGSRIEMAEQILDKVIALYPYKAQNDDELSFEKDDIISVLGRDEPEWWRGELNGLTGLFPSNYVGPFVTSGKAIESK